MVSLAQPGIESPALPSATTGPAKTGNPFILLLLSLRSRILISLVLVASFSVGVLTYWAHISNLDKEYQAVYEKHLIVAKNLSSELSRYAQDVASTYDFLLNNSDIWSLGQGIPQLLTKFDLRYIAILDSSFKVTQQVLGASEQQLKLPTQEILESLRLASLDAKGKTIFSGIQLFDGSPHIFVIRTLPDGAFSIAPLRPDYLNKVQKSIVFGERGHSMIVDQFGRVIAHPNAEWQAISKDASKLSVVQLMTSGKTGVAEFYSPPMKADMIAGYTNVEETGWGVMVPQPQKELVDRVIEITRKGYLVSALSILLAIVLGWWISGHLSGPISQITIAAKKLAKGEKNIRVSRLPDATPPDLTALALTFNGMVDELDQKNKALTQMLAKSEAGSRAKTKFLGLMSHEFRTPLTGVIGTLELLSDSDADENGKQLIALASVSAAELLHLLTDVLLLVQLDNGGIEPASASLDIKRVVDEVHLQLKNEALMKGNKLEVVYITAPPPTLFSDVKIIRQIFLSLIENAIKFTDDGVVKIIIDVSENPGNEQILTIKVEDSRALISMENQETIFEPFFQMDPSDSRVEGGLSFGLDITRQLVLLLNGEVVCESDPAEGTVFTATIPVKNLKDE